MPHNQKNGWTIIKLLTWAESYFKSHAVDSPRLTAEILLACGLEIKRLDLYLQHDRPLEKNELARFKALIKRRVQNEPVAYITGIKGFWESDFVVTPDVLIPRPETEILVEQALQFLKGRFPDKGPDGRPGRILELGTGSGAVIVSLARAMPGHVYAAGDISLKALAVAKQNAGTLAGKPIRFFAGSWFSCLDTRGKFDLILSNPPYIPARDIETLQPEIRLFEPFTALDGGPDGLAAFREILGAAHCYLAPGGVLLLETGCDQKQGIQRILRSAGGYQPPEFIRDLAGRHRVALIKKAID